MGQEDRLRGAAALQQPAGLRVAVPETHGDVLGAGIQPPLELGVADRGGDRVRVGVAMPGDVDRWHAAIMRGRGALW